jgi:hypothetical protein
MNFSTFWKQELRKLHCDRLESTLKPNHTVLHLVAEINGEEITKTLPIGADRPDARTVTERTIDEFAEKLLCDVPDHGSVRACDWR